MNVNEFHQAKQPDQSLDGRGGDEAESVRMKETEWEQERGRRKTLSLIIKSMFYY